MSKENVQKFLEEAVSTPELAKKLEGLEPVSYTHLDVYKRQAIK